LDVGAGAARLLQEGDARALARLGAYVVRREQPLDMRAERCRGGEGGGQRLRVGLVAPQGNHDVGDLHGNPPQCARRTGMTRPPASVSVVPPNSASRRWSWP